jgi:hypothetical protein
VIVKGEFSSVNMGMKSHVSEDGDIISEIGVIDSRGNVIDTSIFDSSPSSESSSLGHFLQLLNGDFTGPV